MRSAEMVRGSMLQVSSLTPLQAKRIVIAASSVLNGKGQELRDTRIVVEGSKIIAVIPNNDPKAGRVDYDLRGLTVLPGWIDAHVHVTWSFGPNGKNAGQGGATQEAAYAAASNAWLTLMAGFTPFRASARPPTFPCATPLQKAHSPVRAS